MGLFDFLKNKKNKLPSSDPTATIALSDTFKTLAIGDGYLTIQLPSNLSFALEDDDKLLFYHPEVDYITGRISVITVKHKTKPDEDLIFNDIPRRASEKGTSFQEKGKVRYFEYRQESEEDGDPISLWFMEAGYDNHIIITSVTVDKSKIKHDLTQRFLDATRKAQFSIELHNPETGALSDLTEEHQNDLNLRIKRFFDKFCEGKYCPIDQLDFIVEKMPWDPDNQRDWLDLGLAFGDLVSKEIAGFRWKLLRDEYGLTYCLNFNNTTIRTFPMTMFSKRKEDATPFRVIDIYNGLLDTIGDMAKKGY